MKVVINGKEQEIPENITVAELLKYLNFRKKSAVWINEKQLLLRDYDIYKISENENIKILKIIGGG